MPVEHSTPGGENSRWTALGSQRTIEELAGQGHSITGLEGQGWEVQSLNTEKNGLLVWEWQECVDVYVYF